MHIIFRFPCGCRSRRSQMNDTIQLPRHRSSGTGGTSTEKFHTATDLESGKLRVVETGPGTLALTETFSTERPSESGNPEAKPVAPEPGKRLFKKRHIQMMAFGFPPSLHPVISRKCNWNWDFCFIRESSLFWWARLLGHCLLLSRFCSICRSGNKCHLLAVI